MATSAKRRDQLENHLQTFREIGDNRMREKIAEWRYYLPALISSTLAICQIANTIIFFQFAYNFGQLYVLLDDYMHETDARNITLPNSTELYQYDGINAERINEIDLYHDQLWTLFVAEIIELIFPLVNLTIFAWIMQNKKRKLPGKILAIYLLCPALALILSISQACTIYVTLVESIYTIRFLLAKLLGVLLELNKPGRLLIEEFFKCEFFNDDDIVVCDIKKPSCAGQLHDTVVSKSTLTVIITIHIIPVIFFLYLLLKKLRSTKSEHLFLYIESIDKNFRPYNERQKDMSINIEENFQNKQETLMNSLNEMLTGFNVQFVRGRSFQAKIKEKRIKTLIKNQRKERKSNTEMKVETIC